MAQGDGTASIFEGRQDVFTLSVHAESNFPARKQRSHLDIGLPDGTGDEAYLGWVRSCQMAFMRAFCGFQSLAFMIQLTIKSAGRQAGCSKGGHDPTWCYQLPALTISWDLYPPPHTLPTPTPQ